MAHLECFIDFDDEWIQEDCHWKYDRIFTFTYKIPDDFDVSLEDGFPHWYFYYTIGTLEFDASTTTDNIYTEGKLFHKTGTRTWTLELRLSSIPIETLLTQRNSEGWLNLGARLSVKDTSGTVHPAATTYNYFLELAPHYAEAIKTELVINNPGELKCSWTKAVPLDQNSVDSVDGWGRKISSIFCEY